MIYLDHAASTPVAAGVRAAMEPFLGEACGNASSLHAAGRRARKAVEDAREIVARALGGEPKEILFTSGATESNNLALMGVGEALRGRGNHVVTTAIEHPCVLESCARLETAGFRVTRVPVGPTGRVDPGLVARAATSGTVLVSVMWVNHEVGTVQPIREIRRLLGPGVLFHTDAAQALGKIPVDVRDVDLLTFSAHKIHGPKGVGGLWVRKGVPLRPLLVGGGQEFERRAGTENVAGIVGLGEAVRSLRLPNAALRDRLQEGLLAVEGTRLLGDPAHRAPHLLTVAFEGVDGEAAILALDAEGVCVSTGSACASMSLRPSHVLQAMGVPPDVARGSVRFGLSAMTTEAEIDAVLEIVPRVVGRLRKISPAVR